MRREWSQYSCEDVGILSPTMRAWAKGQMNFKPSINTISERVSLIITTARENAMTVPESHALHKSSGGDVISTSSEV